jgi:predicted component of type VI protein secretion system
MVSYCLISSLFTPRVRILRRGRTYVFGRDKTIDFPIPSDVVSRKHAELAWNAAGSFCVRDLGSKNGTRVNNVPVLSTHVLRDGETVTIGPFSFQYREYEGDIEGLMNEPEAADLEATAALDGDVLAHMQRVRAGLAPATPPAGFAGNFEGIELLEICRLIGAGERDGILTIQGGELSGQLGFQRGEIRRAVAGRAKAEEAALALLSLPAGRFEFTAGPMTLEVNCRVRADSLAMEVARRQDEQSKANAATEATAQLAPGPHAADSAAEASPGAGTAEGGAGSRPSSGDPAETDGIEQPQLAAGELQVEPTERIPKLPPGAGRGGGGKLPEGPTVEIDPRDLEGGARGRTAK